MKQIIQDLMPHAPQMGLFVTPDIPQDRLRNALQDYAHEMDAGEVLALYDATLRGSGKDGAVFAADRFVFQNTDLQAPQTVRYADLVGVEAKRKWMGIGGRKLELKVNRGRATFDLSMDFSGQPDAAEYVAAFLDKALLEGVRTGSGSRTPASDAPSASRASPSGAPASDASAPDAAAPPAPGTDVDALRDALTQLRDDGALADADFDRILHLFRGE